MNLKKVTFKFSILSLFFSVLLMASVPAHAFQYCSGGNLVIDNSHEEIVGGVPTWIVDIEVIYNSSVCMMQ